MSTRETVVEAEEPALGPQTTRSQKMARLVLGIGLFGFGVWTLHSFLPALAWAAIFAIATWPSYQRAQRRWPPGKHNILLPAVFTLAIALIFIVPLALLAVQLGREAHNLFKLAEGVQQSGLPVPDWVSHLPFGAQQVTDWWNSNLNDPEDAQELMRRFSRGEVVALSRSLGAQLVHRVVLFGFTLLTLFFLFRDGPHLTEQMLRASQRAFGARGERIGRQVIASVHGTVDGLVLVGLGEGLLLGIAYALAGVPHPTLLGTFTAVAAMVPFGAPLVFGAASLLVLANGSGAVAIALFAFGMAVVFIADHFIRPVLIGGSTRLPFLWVLLGILGGVETWGLLGLFLGPALMAALVLLWREWVAKPEEAPATSRTEPVPVHPLRAPPGTVAAPPLS
jgi:predicted PurR-regulated permease PerM